MRTYTVTDQISGQTITGDSEHIKCVMLDAWFADAPNEIYTALQDLEEALDRHQYTGELEALLAISIEHHTH